MNRRHLILAVIAPLLFIGLVGLDRRLTHADRERHARRVDAFLRVRDQILRYEHEQGALPPSLAAMVPTYVVREQITHHDKPLYTYEPTKRFFAMASGTPVRGLFTRTYAAAFRTLPPLGVGDRVQAAPALRQAELFTPQASQGEPVPPGGFVFEAEDYTAMNYGWEVTPDAQAGGGAYIHVKEGMANTSGQRVYGLGDFYNVGDVRDITYLKFHFHLPKAGRYYVYGRMWTTGVHCSNNILVGFDRDAEHAGRIDNRTPFRWAWTPISRLQGEHLTAGDHYLHLFPHEDGVRIDQFLISPVRVQGNKIFKANLRTAEGTVFAEHLADPIHLTFDLKSMIMTPKLPPQVRLAIRRIKATEGRAQVEIKLEQAGVDGKDLLLGRFAIDLAALPPLAFLPVDFSALDLKTLKRREYLLKATLKRDDTLLAACHIPLMKPFAWQVLGMLPYYSNDEAGPADADKEPGADLGVKWQPFDPKNFDHFGVLDFGLQTIGNSLQAPAHKTIYARTVISVPSRMPCLLKLQSDDQMLLWIDGRFAGRMDSTRPVTRAAKWLRVIFTPGTHRIRMRVNQGQRDHWGDGRWQAHLRIRTAKDGVVDIVGLDG